MIGGNRNHTVTTAGINLTAQGIQGRLKFIIVLGSFGERDVRMGIDPVFT
jgi:hypothetical protein